MVALLRDQRVDAESQPPHRTASQRRARQRPDLSGVRRNRTGRPALSRPARRGAGRDVVGGRADCRDRQPQAAVHRHVAPAVRSRLPCRSASRMAGCGPGLRRRSTAADIETLSTTRRCRFSSCSRRCTNRRRKVCTSGCSVRSSYPKSFSARSRAIRVQPAAARLPDNWISTSREFYLTNVLQDIPEISSMAQLVEFTTEIADLRQAVPAFL